MPPTSPTTSDPTGSSLPSPRRLVLLRHAQAVAMADDDQARTLTPRGEREAAAVGRWLVENDVRIEHAVVSMAVRTRQTWEGLRASAGIALEADLRVGLYSAGPETALDELRLCPDDAHTVLMVGHNPTIAYLATLLDDGQGDPRAQAALLQGFAPATSAVLEFAGSWSGLAFGEARLLDVHTARA